MEARTTTESAERLALSATEVAELLGVSTRHIWKLHASGRLPMPVRLGRSVRWRRDELLAWLEAACPGRDCWEQLKAAKR